MKHGSLFSGIGGFDLAAEWVGWENVLQVENDKFCNKVLKKNFPKVKRYGDIKEFKGKPGQCDIISGGFPCQPFSHAGKRQGETDNRFLWFEMLRVITEIKPSWVVGENVTGLLSLENGKTFDRILTSLETKGYTIESFIIPACGVGAWHRRDRVWIIAHSSSTRRTRNGTNEIDRCNRNNGRQNTKILQDVSNTDNQGLQRNRECRENKGWGNTKRYPGQDCRARESWTTEPKLGRVANGIPNRVDRLKGLGNAIIPQVAFELFKAIDNEP